MDQMKSAFISGSSYEAVENLNTYLQSKNIRSELDWYIGYRTIRVHESEYNKAITIGAYYLGENDKKWHVCWVSPDGTRMHNADNLAVAARNAIKNKKYLDDKSIEELAQARYSTFKSRQEFEQEFSK